MEVFMRFILSAAVLMSLSACSDGGKDTGDSGPGDTNETDTNNPMEFMLLEDGSGAVFGTGATGTCDMTGCVYTMTTTTEASMLELDMTETDDPGLYTENHTGFALDSENADGSYTYKLVLAGEPTPNYTANETTLFWPGNPLNPDIINESTTWYFGATSLDGNTLDCVVTGDNPDYYSEWCSNVE
jgi:hypothetical protein